MLKKILIGLAAAAALFAIVGWLLPSTAHVERATVVQAPAATVFTVLNGFRQFDKWSPWAGIDPDAKTTFEGPAFGVGAKMSWAGNDAVGTGSQEIVESTPYGSIRLRLGFGDFPGTFASSYALQPVEGGTQVTWAFDADYGGSLTGRWFGLLSDRMIGPDYDKGLQRLKALVEAMPKGDFSQLRIEAVSLEATPVVMTAVHARDEPRSVGLALGVAWGQLAGYLAVQGVKPAAPSVAIFRGSDAGTLTLDAAIPVAQAIGKPAGAVRAGELPAGPAVRAEYRGALAGMPAARAQLEAYLAASGLERSGPIWAQYVGDPAKTPAAELVTLLFAPVR